MSRFPPFSASFASPLTVSASGSAHSYLEAAVSGTSGGDPHVRLTIPSGTSWYIGLDNSASDFLHIGTGTAVGTTPAISINTNLNVTFSGAIFLGGVILAQDGVVTDPGYTFFSEAGSGTRSGMYLSGSTLNLSSVGINVLQVNSLGTVIVGTAGSAVTTTATDGFLYIPTCAGTPTGVPTAVTGKAPLVVNTTNNKLYFYSTGAWRDAGP